MEQHIYLLTMQRYQLEVVTHLTTLKSVVLALMLTVQEHFQAPDKFVDISYLLSHSQYDLL